MPTRILVVDDSPTIRRVVSTILERHGYEPSLASDGEDAMQALASGEVKADLVLLDFVMPRMNGYQFCRALRAHEGLASTPVVLMSAKADRIRDQFVSQTGALDAITKPFDAQVLVTVVENALRRVAAGFQSSARLPDDVDFDADNPPGSVLPSPASRGETGDEPNTRSTHVAQIVATKLAHLVTRTLAEKPNATPGELAGALTDRLSNEAVIEMFEAVRALQEPIRDTSGPLLSGDLGVIPIGAVLQLLQAENQTGVLYCWKGDTEIVAAFRKGLIDLVQSSGAGDEFRLGRFFVEEGILTPSPIEDVLNRPHNAQTPLAPPVSPTRTVPFPTEDAPRSRVNIRGDGPPSRGPAKTWGPDTIRDDPHLRRTVAGNPASIEALVAASSKPRPLGSMLLAAGKIMESQLRTALTRQSSELLYEVLRWSRGRFELRLEPPSELAEQARLGMPVASVVIEGFRRVDEWRVVERTLGSFDAVLVRDETALGTLDVASLPPKEKAVFDVVDGERTVRALVLASHMSSFEACRILAQFMEARVLRRRSA